MLRKISLALFTVIFSSFVFAAQDDQIAETENIEVLSQTEDGEILSEEEEYYKWITQIWESLDRQTGTIAINEAGATMNVPENFYYLNAKDAERVLVEVWGNPPSETTLGMLFPAEMTPFDSDSWAVTIEYEEDGYVSDEDAGDLDYSELLEQMKDDTQAASEARVAQGYEEIELIGWAASPFYDAGSHKLHWAKEIRFGDEPLNTLNYNIRILGRKGVLVLNFIAAIDQKDLIESNLDSVLAIADFDQGSKYGDFNPELDTVAAYGIGALVAGKVLAKTGFLVLALAFLKKFGIFILIGLGALLKGVFSRKKTE